MLIEQQQISPLLFLIKAKRMSLFTHTDHTSSSCLYTCFDQTSKTILPELEFSNPSIQYSFSILWTKIEHTHTNSFHQTLRLDEPFLVCERRCNKNSSVDWRQSQRNILTTRSLCTSIARQPERAEGAIKLINRNNSWRLYPTQTRWWKDELGLNEIKLKH